jgi:hypothetical protein
MDKALFLREAAFTSKCQHGKEGQGGRIRTGNGLRRMMLFVSLRRAQMSMRSADLLAAL